VRYKEPTCETDDEGEEENERTKGLLVEAFSLLYEDNQDDFPYVWGEASATNERGGLGIRADQGGPREATVTNTVTSSEVIIGVKFLA
jgi:hypothetical protein